MKQRWEAAGRRHLDFHGGDAPEPQGGSRQGCIAHRVR